MKRELKGGSHPAPLPRSPRSRVRPYEEGTERTNTARATHLRTGEAEFVPMKRELKARRRRSSRTGSREAEFVPMKRELKAELNLGIASISRRSRVRPYEEGTESDHSAGVKKTAYMKQSSSL